MFTIRSYRTVVRNLHLNRLRCWSFGAMLCAVCLASVLPSEGVELTTLYSFSGPDGGWPISGLTLSGSTLYGSTQEGGAYHDFPGIGDGTVFSLPVTGGSLNWSTSFNSSTGWILGDNPRLLLVGSNLYGTANGGGAGVGTVFRMPVTGGSPTVLAHLNGSSGGNPSAGLTLSADGSTLYGTAGLYGANGNGTVFRVPIGGGSATAVTSFNGTNGSSPTGAVTLVGSTLYGTTTNGGAYGLGTLFSVPVSGGASTVLHSFNGATGANPAGTLIVNGTTLYGTTQAGGANGKGTVFSIPVTGGSPTTLVSFNGANGANPLAGVALSGSTLYGTTMNGGDHGSGTVFGLPVSGGPTTTLFSFNGANGVNPQGDLVVSGSTLYGTTHVGGAYDRGTVFALDLTSAPQPPSPNAVQWPKSAGGNDHWYEAVHADTPAAYVGNGNYTGGITWTAARDAAIANGGWLTDIHSAAENDFVFNMVTPDLWYPEFGNSVGLGPWLGGFQPDGSQEPAGNWQWTTGGQITTPDGSPAGYANWYPGQPRNHFQVEGSGPPEDALHFYANTSGWQDMPSWAVTNGYIVEYVPEPSTIALLIAGAVGLVAVAWRKWRAASVVAVFCVVCLTGVAGASGEQVFDAVSSFTEASVNAGANPNGA